MACFLVPVTEAVIVTVTAAVLEKKERKAASLKPVPAETPAEEEKVPFSRKLKWLGHMLWGGSALLAFEHVWHGEVVPYFPFLTAASDAESASEMLREMATVGVGMAVIVTAAWLGIIGVVSLINKRKKLESASKALN